jgi:hypothetical protein
MEGGGLVWRMWVGVNVVTAGPVAVQFTALTCHAVKNIGTADASALSYSLQNPELPPPKPTTCLLLL